MRREESTSIPSLLTSTLGAPAAVLGAIEGISDALAGAARLGGGVLADDPASRRRVAVGGYAPTAVIGAAVHVVLHRDQQPEEGPPH
ncbi:hypothetical protein ACFV7R_47005 [Streptomyces sp. NPDC059866]|uniref:hypothetical protein n=1 Tax=Streptomyces sp. NPDC059866 TaxID=3346978 RepID=UPI00366105C2